jgi:type IV pilus assembly protein PilY1
LVPELSRLTSPTYVHQYYVDGIFGKGDAYDGANWHTLLAGATGAGGRALFMLDITNPDAFGSSSALWEFTNTNDVDLGYTLAQPSVVRTQDGNWAVIVGNGYNSDNGHAVLFVLNAFTGAVLQKIDTGAGTTANKNGLSSPIAVDTNNDRSVDTVYAGDLYGNLWKFNLSGSAGSWSIPGGSPLFVACTITGTSCPAANRQPITAKPNVGAVSTAATNQNGVGIMVYFGTGKYFEPGDNNVGTSPQVETFYGLWDNGSAITNRALLQEQTIDFQDFLTLDCVNPGASGCDKSAQQVRVVSSHPTCYGAGSPGCTSTSPLKKGWALNLLKPPVPIAQGERAVSFPLLRRGLVVFPTVIPTPDVCGSGGTSFLMEVDALTGGAFTGAPFDVSGNGVVDIHDFVVINGVSYIASGVDMGVGITKTPTVVESTSVDYKYSSGSTGQLGTVVDAGGAPPPSSTPLPVSSGTRRAWQQLK